MVIGEEDCRWVMMIVKCNKNVKGNRACDTLLKRIKKPYLQGGVCLGDESW